MIPFFLQQANPHGMVQHLSLASAHSSTIWWGRGSLRCPPPNALSKRPKALLSIAGCRLNSPLGRSRVANAEACHAAAAFAGAVGLPAALLLLLALLARLLEQAVQGLARRSCELVVRRPNRADGAPSSLGV